MDTALKNSVLNLESLELQFKNTSVQYEKAYLNYINTLNRTTGKIYNIVPSMTYWGAGALSQVATPSVQSCKAICSSNNKCNGATYNSDKGMCFLRTGVGALNPSNSNNTAIITQLQNNILEVSALNQELIRLNTEINNSINRATPIVQSNATAVAVKQRELRDSHNKLMQEQASILNTMNDISKTSQDYEDTSIEVTQSNISYVYWIIIAIIVVFITIKLILSAGASKSSSYSQ
jgi:hypothetical protein